MAWLAPKPLVVQELREGRVKLAHSIVELLRTPNHIESRLVRFVQYSGNEGGILTPPSSSSPPVHAVEPLPAPPQSQRFGWIFIHRSFQPPTPSHIESGPRGIYVILRVHVWSRRGISHACKVLSAGDFEQVLVLIMWPCFCSGHLTSRSRTV